MAKRRRAPGGGRKPKEGGALPSPLSIRLPIDIRKRLELAVEKNALPNWNLSQEIIARLRRSMSEKFDPTTRALCFWLGELIELAKANTEEQPQPDHWRDDPFAYLSIKAAFNLMLDAVAPRGETKPPTEIFFNPLFAIGGANTPEEMGKALAQVMLSLLNKPPMEDPFPGQVFPKSTRDIHYGMVDVKRDLLRGSKS